MLHVFFFFFKQKTAYEMRISDWSSDVCSSDLGTEESRQRRLPTVCKTRKPESDRLDQGSHRPVHDRGGGTRRPAQARRHPDRGNRRHYRARTAAGRQPERLQADSGDSRQVGAGEDLAFARARHIGREPCRERAWLYVLNSSVAVSLKKKK